MERCGGQKQVDGAISEHLRRVLVADGQCCRIRLPGHFWQHGRWQLDGFVCLSKLQRNCLSIRACGAIHEYGCLLGHGWRIAAFQRHADSRQSLMIKNTKVSEKGLTANNGFRLIISIAEVVLFQCIFFYYYNYYTRAQDTRKYFKYARK